SEPFVVREGIVLTSAERLIACDFSRSPTPTDTKLDPTGATPLMLVPVTTTSSTVSPLATSAGALCASATPLASDVADSKAARESPQERCVPIVIVPLLCCLVRLKAFSELRPGRAYRVREPSA